MPAMHVTEAESAVLDALWRCGPLPPARLVLEVKARRDWGEATIKTLLGRLMQKKIVRSAKTDGVLRYHPLIDRQAYVASEVDQLVARLFDGDRAALATFLATAPAEG
ncbi:BlaI/MecI/CopY family transcriptional regulator [Caulobacter sp. KR2-114]|uniref:BlaI/MecI/CopY family transcriptional regulator n=1 Tax=Caulobacter sp. KR2-114 TaxID=3400912 RepID=UPI003BFC8B23